MLQNNYIHKERQMLLKLPENGRQDNMQNNCTNRRFLLLSHV
jgi:hypothetical protein